MERFKLKFKIKSSNEFIKELESSHLPKIDDSVLIDKKIFTVIDTITSYEKGIVLVYGEFND